MEPMKRPVIKIKKTYFEIIFNSIAIVLFLADLIYILSVWQTLPPEIPTHFNGAGEVDGVGSKGTLLILPIVGMVLWIGLSILENYPHLYNYIRLSEKTLEKQYRNGVLLVHLLKNFIILFFVYLNWKTIRVALGNEHGLGVWPLITFMVIIFGTLIIFIVRSLRIR